MLELNNIYQETEQKMKRSLDALLKELSKIRTDRAHPSLLEDLQVNYYNQSTPISRIANIIVEDHRSLVVTPFDKGITTAIEKAILAANLGLNPVVTGNVIRVPIPQITEERRKNLAKQIKSELELARVAVRNVRRDSNMQIKNLVTNKQISLNEKEIAENKIQKLTDSHIEQIEQIGIKKEKDIMHV